MYRTKKATRGRKSTRGRPATRSRPRASTGALAHVRRHATKYGLGASAVTALAVADQYLKRSDKGRLYSSIKGLLSSTPAGRNVVDKVEKQEAKVETHAEDAAKKSLNGDTNGANNSAKKAANAAFAAEKLKQDVIDAAAKEARLRNKASQRSNENTAYVAARLQNANYILQREVAPNYQGTRTQRKVDFAKEQAFLAELGTDPDLWGTDGDIRKSESQVYYFPEERSKLRNAYVRAGSYL